jgi:hypothetical protein
MVELGAAPVGQAADPGEAVVQRLLSKAVMVRPLALTLPSVVPAAEAAETQVLAAIPPGQAVLQAAQQAAVATPPVQVVVQAEAQVPVERL